MTNPDVKKISLPFGDRSLGPRTSLYNASLKLPPPVTPAADTSVEWIRGIYEELDGCYHRTNKVKGLEFISSLPAAILALCVRYKGFIRPGFMGVERGRIEALCDQTYGEGGWEYGTLLNGKVSDPSVALRIYENAYLRRLMSDPALLERMTREWKDVYDTAPSNMNSGFNYAVQEAPLRGHHLQDISLRTSLARLGHSFQGEQLMQVRHVRDEKSAGFLSPGVVPFGAPKAAMVLPPRPELWSTLKNSPLGLVPIEKCPPWWQKDSIEDVYQRTRCITVARSPKRSKQQTTPAVVAADFIAKIVPIIQELQLSQSELTTVPWAISHQHFPATARNQYREYKPEFIEEVVLQLEISLPILASDKSTGLQFSPQSVNTLRHARLDSETTVRNGDRALRTALISEQRHVSNISALIKKATKVFPRHSNVALVFLARDGLAALEFCHYQKELGASLGPIASVYLPGSPSGQTSKNNHELQSGDSAVWKLVQHLFRLARDTSGIEQFRKEVRAQLEGTSPGYPGAPEDNLSSQESQMVAGRMCENLLRQLGTEKLPERIVVIDTYGTGKSVAYAAEAIRWYAKTLKQNTEVAELLGQSVKDSALGIPSTFESNDQEFFPDLNWPFFAQHTPTLTSDEQHFQVRGDITSWVRLAIRSLSIYNRAVKSLR